MKISTKWYLILCFRIPYAELNEPFYGYFDGANNRSRVDYYGDIDMTFQRGELGKFGSMFRVAYMTNQTHYNYRRCFQLDGDGKPMIYIWNYMYIVNSYNDEAISSKPVYYDTNCLNLQVWDVWSRYDVWVILWQVLSRLQWLYTSSPRWLNL